MFITSYTETEIDLPIYLSQYCLSDHICPFVFMLKEDSHTNCYLVI